jgi:hypothetical protein
MFCENCGASVQDDSAFCASCGWAQAPLGAATTAPSSGECRACGAHNAPDDAFCGRCGAKLEGRQAVATNSPWPVVASRPLDGAQAAANPFTSTQNQWAAQPTRSVGLPAAAAPRPASITVVCVIGSLGALLLLPLSFSPTVAEVGAWYQIYSLLSFFVASACMVGLWMMKRWAAYTYAGALVLGQFVMLARGTWNVLDFAIPAIIVFLVLRSAPRMS